MGAIKPVENLKEFLSLVLLHLFIPIRVFKLGHVVALLYIGVSLAGAVTISHLLQLKLHLFIEMMAQKYQYHPDITSRMHIFGSVVCWLLVSPLYVSGTALPSRLIYVHGKLPPFLLLKETPMAIRLALQSTVLAIRISLYYLAAPLALLLAHQVFLGQSRQIGTVVTSYFLLAVVFVWAFVKVIPIALVPFVAVVGFYEPWGAVGAARQITHKAEGIPGILLALALFLTAGAKLLLDAISLGNVPLLLPSLESFIVGYLLLCLSGLVVTRVATMIQAANTPSA